MTNLLKTKTELFKWLSERERERERERRERERERERGRDVGDRGERGGEIVLLSSPLSSSLFIFSLFFLALSRFSLFDGLRRGILRIFILLYIRSLVSIQSSPN